MQDGSSYKSAVFGNNHFLRGDAARRFIPTKAEIFVQEAKSGDDSVLSLYVKNKERETVLYAIPEGGLEYERATHFQTRPIAFAISGIEG